MKNTIKYSLIAFLALALLAAGSSIGALSQEPLGPTLVYVVEVLVTAQGSIVGWERVVYEYSLGAGAGGVRDFVVTGVYMDPGDVGRLLERALRGPVPSFEASEDLIYAVEGEAIPYRCVLDSYAPLAMSYRGRVVEMVFQGRAYYSLEAPVPLKVEMQAYIGELSLPNGVTLRDVSVLYNAVLSLASEPVCGDRIAGEEVIVALAVASGLVIAAAAWTFINRERLRVY